MSPVYDKVMAVRQDMNRILLERESAIDHALIALLCRQHFLMIGGPGTAKSMLVDALHARIEEARKFKVFFTPGTTADELIGPLDLVALTDFGTRLRLTTRSMATCHLAFLDEIGRGNELVYAALLPLMGEERHFDELGMDYAITIPMVSAFAASNSHLIGDKTLEALNNRFALRQEIVSLQSRASLITLATKPPKVTDVQATMTLHDLEAAQQEVKKVKGTPEVLEAMLDLRDQLTHEHGHSITDRMWTWAVPLVKAHAWLHGASAIALEDLQVLAASWWEDPKDAKVVQRTIYEVSVPLDALAQTAEDSAFELLAKMPDETDPTYPSAWREADKQLKDILAKLKDNWTQSKARDKTRALQSLVKIKAAHEGLVAAPAMQATGSVSIDDLLAMVS